MEETNNNPNGDWRFSLEGSLPGVPEKVIKCFQRDGFVVFPKVLGQERVNSLNERLEEVLRGKYNRGVKPDKTPRRVKTQYSKEEPLKTALGFSGNTQGVKVMQIINIHKADKDFRAIATHPALGKLVAQLAGWSHGARLAQDQVWAKPPQAPALSFHRDSPYFMFSPPHVMTVWLALDRMDKELGPLEYVCGSHVWGDGRIGSTSQFFGSDNSLLRSAAERAGVQEWKTVSMEGLAAGGLSIHDGRTWHGSGKNCSHSKPRRGLGLHFVPNEVRWTKEASFSRLWKDYVKDADEPEKVELSPTDFPTVWAPSTP